MAAASKRTHTVTMIEGDGIGHEVAEAVKSILEAAEAPVTFEPAVAGKKAFEGGVASGVPKETIESLDRNRIGLKGPLETPVGYGGKSANVTLRKIFEMYGNIRPCRELPNVPSAFAGRGIDLIVVRENVEDLYAGIEHMQSPGVAQSLKCISEKGCDKIVRLAYALARSQGRKRVTCATKANILKKTEGMLKRRFEAVAPEFSEFTSDHIIIDNLCHRLVLTPEDFDVIVATNMNGDIVSDLTSGLVGGLGIAPSMNIGNEAVMFEAVHGSAPDIAGKDMANPTALLLSALMMLRHLGEFAIADTIEHALYVTFEEGTALTGDIARDHEPVGTKAFTERVISHFGKRSSHLSEREYRPIAMPELDKRLDYVTVDRRRDLGADVFVESAMDPMLLGRELSKLVEGTDMKLKMISNRGTMAWPDKAAVFDGVDWHRCRFITVGGVDMTEAMLIDLLQRVGAEHRWMHVERLPEFDGEPGYTLAQGEN